MSTISNERLEEITNDKMINQGSEFAKMATELLALRKERERAEPVVNDERYQKLSESYHAQEKRLFKLAQRIKGPSFDKYAHSPSQAIDVLEVAIFGENDDACRAAMPNQSQPVAEADTTSQQFESLASVKQLSSNLAATGKASRDSDDNSSHDSQTTIKQSDGWIPCSERMPDFYYSCLAADEHGDMVIGLPNNLKASDRKAFRLSNGGLFFATHWQPLPEPPCK
ncbi:DUF551 domain-containing protein [Cronobacter dublinensis]|uniref:DUF551 domain-containing protein n=1 Tax=Cronobacter dublinensis TaxID=413497 RepID=UPI002A17817A|nr:DUF551 domain-containing protein [Cronobacter dublinensis]